MDHIENRAEFTYIRYANCWEDTEVLCRALDPQGGKRILSIASAGDNSLALIAHGAEVVAVDLNPTQLACVELRCLLIRQLAHEECLGFLGINPAKNRLDVYKRLKAELSPPARSFFDQHTDIIEQGLIHGGKFERYFHLFRKVLITLIHSQKDIEELLREKSKEQRYAFYQKVWANRRWHWMFKIFFSKFVMGRMGRDPEFFRYVDVPVAENILKRAKYALTELTTHDNPYLDYVMTSNFGHCLPYYLREDIYYKIREHLDHLILYEGTIQQAAKKYGTEKFDGFNLSDIFEYLDEATCATIYRTLLEHARPKTRLAYWNMLVPRKCPPEYADQIQDKKELASSLFATDKAFFYSNFVVEEVK